jgi:DNA polymerase V
MLSAPPLISNARLLGPAVIDGPAQSAPMAGARALLGFPSPAEDFLDDSIDLHRLLIRNPAATFLYRADGWSMIGAGICDGDILVIDRSVRPRSGDIVIAVWDGNQPSCKVLKTFEQHIELHSANADYPPIVLPPGTEVEVFAMVGLARQMIRRSPRGR